MAKKKNEYFDELTELVGYSCEAGEYLHNFFKEFDLMQIDERKEAMHKIEHTADGRKHEMMQKLMREFITPIEREDIMQLAQEIDEVTDRIEDVFLRIYMYNIQTLRPDALTFSHTIFNCCKALKMAVQELYQYKKPDKISPYIIQVNSLEEEGDKLYMEAVRRLYLEESDPITIMAWTETFNRMERCCDACEHAANVVESVIMKNS